MCKNKRKSIFQEKSTETLFLICLVIILICITIIAGMLVQTEKE